MLLSPEDARLFFTLLPALQVFGNQRLNIVKNLKDTEQYKKISTADRLTLRDAVYAKPEIITAFVSENPFAFSKDELEFQAVGLPNIARQKRKGKLSRALTLTGNLSNPKRASKKTGGPCSMNCARKSPN